MNSRWGQVAEWLKNSDPKYGAEIGVKEGRFISYLLAQFPQLTMYAVDPWENQPEGSETYIGWNWDQIYGQYQQAIKPYRDRVIELRLYSEGAAKLIEDGSLDFVFIDAQHDFNSVMQDIEIWRPKLKPGGLLSGHDYQPKFQGLMRAVNISVKDPILGANDTWATWV